MFAYTTTSISLPEEYQPYAILITGVIMACISLHILLKTRRLTRHGIQTTGTLVRVEPNRLPRIHFGEDATTHHEAHDRQQTGIYSYTDAAGHRYELKSPAPAYPVIGKSTITVLYNPRRPNDALAVDAIRPLLLPTITAIVGIGATIISLYQLLS
jgi:hypothetical protein